MRSHNLTKQQQALILLSWSRSSDSWRAHVPEPPLGKQRSDRLGKTEHEVRFSGCRGWVTPVPSRPLNIQRETSKSDRRQRRRHLDPKGKEERRIQTCIGGSRPLSLFIHRYTTYTECRGRELPLGWERKLRVWRGTRNQHGWLSSRRKSNYSWYWHPRSQ